jgi:hypothetical protein
MTASPSDPDNAVNPVPASNLTLNYAPPAPTRLTARQIRWIIVLIALWLGGIALLLNPFVWEIEPLGYGIFGTPVGPIERLEIGGLLGERGYYFAHVAGFASLFLLSQWLFLLPRGRFSFALSDQSRSRRWAVIGAGFVGMLLTAGAAACLLEIAHVWQDWLDADLTLGRLVLHGFYGFWAGMLAAWAAWAMIFFMYFRDVDHRTAVARMTRVLLAGTFLELLISIPAYVKLAREPSDCYCSKGSYTGLVFGCTAVFWLFGPGVYLLLLREKRRWKPRV